MTWSAGERAACGRPAPYAVVRWSDSCQAVSGCRLREGGETMAKIVAGVATATIILAVMMWLAVSHTISWGLSAMLSH